MSSNVAISAERLGKVYKLYDSPADRLRDALGLNRFRRVLYQEFWALRNVSLELAQGERIGIVGRNGAGKSTFLKIVSGRTTPSEGRVEVRGNVQALLEMGTGFHPEFTGIENIRASLSYFGLSPREIRQKETEIIEFAELGEFVAHPIKTYSAGMYARLAFSVATSIEPEILIIDEILGAGDAYFAAKSIDRMKRLATNSGATVLFVSHDTAMVEMLCERCIWLERGVVKMDGPSAEVSKAYAAMIREMTADRIRTQNELAARAESTAGLATARRGHVQELIRFEATEAPAAIASVSLRRADGHRINVRLGLPQDNSIDYDAFVLTAPDSSTWGAPEKVEGRLGRRTATPPDQGSMVVFNLDHGWRDAGAEVLVEWSAPPEVRIPISAYDGEIYRAIGVLDGAAGAPWRSVALPLPQTIVSSLFESAGIASDEALGDAEILLAEPAVDGEVVDAVAGVALTSVEIFANGEPTSLVRSFDELRVEIGYRAATPVEATFVVCLHRLGVIALQAVSSLDSAQGTTWLDGTGTCKLVIPSLPLGAGSYLMSVGIFPPLDHRSLDTERTAYVLHDRRYRLEVEQPEPVALDLGMCRSEVCWEVADAEAARSR